MKKIKLLSLIGLFLMGSLSAQSFVGKLNYNPNKDYKVFASTDTLKILAVMVEFAEDNDNATFGNGKFGSIYSKDYGETILDPLPHNKTYFENHLKFIQNYYRKVSGGKLNISFTVLDNTLSVSKTMRNYSPPLNDLNDISPVGEFAKEVWEKADAEYPSFNFAGYNMFVIFHAGVGKDVSLPGSLGNEHDLPSLYLNEKTLQNIFGTNFDGFPMNGGSFKITNSAILPETESRELEGFDGVSLIELTTNGLIAATVGSYLGLPDLYNTETGRSAIGRFGLMDGQSMFTYQGIFPPEPSAWEKIFLGWSTPVEISVSDKHVNLINKYIANPSVDTSLVKIPINSTEYYLIENRKRDAFKDGSKVTYVSNGVTYSKVFDRDYPNYIYYSVDTLQGVIIDVDEYDWALPGGDRNSKIENFEDVGLIIWHIDESIINSNYESNTINNDDLARGIALVEADGIRDIGEEFQTIFGETVIGEGTKEDTWYKNNPAEYYENIFSDLTKPKALTNTGANSLVTISDFSEVANRASFNVKFGSDDIDFIANFNLGTIKEILSLSSVNNENEVVQFAFTENEIIKFNSNGIICKFTGNEMNRNKPLLVGYGGKEIIVRTANDTLILFFCESSSITPVTLKNNSDEFTTSAVLFSKDKQTIQFLIGTLSGKILKYNVDLTSRAITLVESESVFSSPVMALATNGVEYFAISTNNYWSSSFPDSQVPLKLNEDAKQLAVTFTKVDDYSLKTDVIILTKEGFEIYNGSDKQRTYSLGSEFHVSQFALSDIKKDGANYILFNDYGSLSAINLTAASADNFPFIDEFETEFYSSPLSVDLNNDNAGDVISFTVNGKIVAVDGVSGEILDGFPIASGGKVLTTPIIFDENDRTALGVVTKDAQYLSWNISKYKGKKFWTEQNGNSFNTSFVGGAENIASEEEFFPQAKAYNWPNPVYEGSTNIRYYVAEDSKAEVTIFDLAGDLVAKLSGNGIGGFDNEIVWDVTNIQSGVYFAHLQVTGVSGKTDSKIIKIAIIK